MQDVSGGVGRHNSPDVAKREVDGVVVLQHRCEPCLKLLSMQVFSSPDAVQDVSKILNAYASADMRDLALVRNSFSSLLLSSLELSDTKVYEP